MAIPRKVALDRLHKYGARVSQHFAKIAANPGHSAIPHWRGEIRAWLNIMQEMIPHVGKKTGAEWLPRVEAWEEGLEKQDH